MTRTKIMAALFLVCLAVLPTAAHAQSAIAGVVKDTSGAVVPGATVTAASPALIEKMRTVTTDSSGQYKIVDLRPGVYTLTFALPGMTTIKKEGLELSAAFTATVNAELKVGGIEDSTTVTAEAPVVDVQTNTRAAMLPRNVLDAVPNAHTLQSVGQLIVGVTLTAPDVGGSQAMQQTYFAVHGAGAGQTSVLMDGMIINGLQGDGAIQSYLNDAGSSEMVYQTGGGSADSAAGGVKINLVPKEGGNALHGSLFAGVERSGWQSSNLSPFLSDHGVRSVDKIGLYRDIDVTQGGPIVKDKLWFFVSGRLFTVNKPISNTFHVPSGRTYADCANGVIACEQGVDGQTINSALGRITWQVSPRNKLSAYVDKIWKSRSAAMQPGDDPDTSSVVWTSPLYMTSTLKWTSTISPRLMVDGGFSSNVERYENLDQPGLAKDWGTPEWFTTAPHRDTTLGTTSRAVSIATGGGEYQKSPDRYNLQGSASYVTGSHNIKVGTQYSWGRDGNTLRQNADLTQIYQNNAPFSVVLEGTANPRTYWTERLNGALGLYAQDQWTFRRVTVNYALRWDYVSEKVEGQAAQTGRFANVPAFGDIQMPIWKTWSPRASAVWDVTGDGKTAMRAGFNRFQSAATTTFAAQYDPANALLIQVTAPWNDKNRDDIAQGAPGCNFATDPGCEINFATVPANFGVLSLANPDPGIKRPYMDQFNVGLTREAIRGLSLSFDWFHNNNKNIFVRNNVLRPGTFNADGTVTNPSYRPVVVYSPIDGHAITVYDTVSPAAQRAVQNVDTNDSRITQKYDAFELNFNARLPKGGRIFGGTSTDRSIANTCAAAATNPNLLAFCDQSQSGIPWRTQFKLAAVYEVAWGVRLSGAFQSLPGFLIGTGTLASGIGNGAGNPNFANPNGLGSVWNVNGSTRYVACPGNSAASGCQVGALVAPGINAAQLVVPLIAPGTEYTPRLNQLDIAISKRFTMRQFTIEPKIDVFNALNSDDYFSVRASAYTPIAAGVAPTGLNGSGGAYLLPASIIQGRLVRIGANVTW